MMKYFVCVILVLYCILVSTSAACASKEEASDCFFRSQNGGMTKIDVSKAISTYLPWYLRWGFKAFGGTERIMADCDENGDGVITRAESITSTTCLDTCDKRDNVISYLNC